MNELQIVLSLISAIVVLLAIIFEGKLKRSYNERLTAVSFFKEVTLVSPLGWVLILLMLVLNFGNSWIANEDKIKQDHQYRKDSTKYTRIINQLEKKSFHDSIKIYELKNEILNNGFKSDSIKVSIVDNAVAAMEEQRRILDNEKENIFIHMQNEVEDNLKTILLRYDDKYIKGFADTNLFINHKLKNDYISKYEKVSSKRVIIEHLMETSKYINTTNKYADLILKSKSKTEGKKLNIRMFLNNVKLSSEFLYSIYARIYMLSSYKKYESIDFFKDDILPDTSKLNKYILMDYIRSIDFH